MTEKDFEEYVNGLGDAVRVTERVLEGKKRIAVYEHPENGKIFAILHRGSEPLRVEVETDKKLAKLLVEKYESVMASRLMSPVNWVEVICSGQLSDEEVLDLVRLSWEIASKAA